MKQILCTHIDLDGAGCSILFKHRYPSIEVIYCDYDTIDEISKELWDNRDEYDIIFFSDITPNEEFGKKMVTDPKFVLIDHHITREYLSTLSDRPNIIYDSGVCATLLTAQYLGLYVDNYEFVTAVDAYDTWKLDSAYREMGINLNLLFNYYGMEEFVYEFRDMREINEFDTVIIDVLKHLENAYFTEKLEQGKIKTDIGGTTYFEVFISEKRFNLGVLVDHEDFPRECKYIKTININDMVVGLYSDGFDVSKIAMQMGGGGHRTAAGYEIGFLQTIYV